MKAPRSSILFIPLLFLLSCGSGSETEKRSPDFQILRGRAQGTTYRIKYVSKEPIDGLEENVKELLQKMDNSFSMYIDSSGVLDFEMDEKSTCMDPPFRELYGIAREVFDRTDGAFDPTVKPLVDAWGFGPEGKPKGEPDSLDPILERVGMDKLSLDTIQKGGKTCYRLNKPHPMMAFDPNAIAQGYTVDRIARTMKERFEVERAMIQLGGEVRAMGKKSKNSSWMIGVEKPVGPEEKRRIKAIAELDDLSMATSGSYRKFYTKNGKRYPHTIDPRTGKPVQHQLLSATVTHPQCAKADAYATAFMVMGADKATEVVQKNDELEAYFIIAQGTDDYKTFATKGMKEVLKER